MTCMLGKSPKTHPTCSETSCRSCGWEKTEHERRQKILREQGLTVSSDGLKRLMIGGRKHEDSE